MDIIKKSDEYRGFRSDFITITEVISHKHNKTNRKLLKIYVKALDKSLVIFLSPAKDKGKKLLMIQDNLWIYIPSSRCPIRLTPRQILLGQVSYGDIVRTNYQNDYEIVKSKEEVCNKIRCIHLTLIKKRKGATYYRIEYYLRMNNFIPIKAVFLAKSGKALKTAYFGNMKKFYGINKISKITIYDNIKKSEWSEIIIKKYVKQNIENYFFNKAYLKRIEVE